MYLAKAASSPAGIQALLELPQPAVEAGGALRPVGE
jgi:hypothetical protein